jgi:transposase
MSVLQRRAAGYLRDGLSQREAARLVGRSERTLRAWRRDVEGFRELAEGAAEEGPELSALETLRLAQHASRPDGSPDWSIRVRGLSKKAP